MKKLIYIFILIIILSPINVNANSNINIYVVHSNTCGHCQKSLEYLRGLNKDRNDITLYSYEVSESKDEIEKIEKAMGENILSVPYVVIGNNSYVGFLEGNTEEVYLNAILHYKDIEYKDKVGISLGIVEDTGGSEDSLESDYSLNVPLIGNISLKDLSLPLASILIGLVDGFNPCAMWILLFLITMLLGMKDRKKMWLIGSIFLLTSSIVYLFFIMSWVKASAFLNTFVYLRVLISLFALIFGLANLINYFRTRKDSGCLVVKETKRKKIIARIKKIVASKSIMIAVIGTIILAVSVNLIDLLCSLGLPVVFSQLLSLNNLTKFESSIYVFLYIFFFMLDDFVVFAIAMISSKVSAFSTKYSKYSHLVGGIIMAAIGLLMLFKPEWLSFNFK